MKNNIAFFDFDGTITTKDTMLALARFICGSSKFYLGMAVLSPSLIGMKFSLLSKKAAKEKFLKHFFGEIPIEEFNEQCRLFTEQRLPSLLKKEALDAIHMHQASNTPIVVVSASAENWVAPWCMQNNLGCIASRLELKNKRLTGKLAGENCNGIEKVNRIKEQFDLADFSDVYCYGDTSGDNQMLEIASHSFYRSYQ